MEGGYFLPVTSVSSAQVGTTAPAVQGMSSVFTGDMSAFDILMQQLFTTSADSPNVFQQGQMVPFGTVALEDPLISENLSELSEEGMIDIEQLSLLLSQLNLTQPDGTIPQILQEIKDVYAQATALGQSTVDLGSIFASTTQSDITDLVDLAQGTSQDSVKTLFEGMQKYFEAQENAVQPLPAEQQNVKESVEQQLQSLFSEQAGQKAIPEVQNAEMLQARQDMHGELRADFMAQGEAGQPIIQGKNLESQEGLFMTQTPEYLMPDFLKESVVLPQSEQVLTKVVEGELFKQNNVNEQTVRDTSTISNGLHVDNDASQNSASMNMRNSLNLATEGQSGNATLSESSEGSENVNKLGYSFDQNLQRLQETQSVLKQISKHSGIQQGMRTSEINVKLEPEHLGTMKISVKMQDEVINAQITVDNDHVKDLLDSNMTALRSAMSNSEVKIDKVTVEVSADADNSTFINDAAHQGKDLSGQSQESHQRGSFMQGLFDQDISASSQNHSILDQLYQVNYLA